MQNSYMECRIKHHFHGNQVFGYLQPNPFCLRHSTGSAANDDVQTFAKTNPGAGCKWNALIA